MFQLLQKRVKNIQIQKKVSRIFNTKMNNKNFKEKINNKTLTILTRFNINFFKENNQAIALI